MPIAPEKVIICILNSPRFILNGTPLGARIEGASSAAAAAG